MKNKNRSNEGEVEQKSLVLDDNGDVTIRVHEFDPFEDTDEAVEITDFKVSRQILGAASPMFNSMLVKGSFVESRARVVNFYEDTGISCRAIAAVFRALYISHEQSVWLPEEEIRREEPHNDEILYKVTPLHIVEILRHMCDRYLRSKGPKEVNLEYRYRDVSVDSEDFRHCSVSPVVISSDAVCQWLAEYSEETSEGIRTMKPLCAFKAESHQLDSILYQVVNLMEQLPAGDTIKAAGLIDELLEPYRIPDPHEDISDLANGHIVSDRFYILRLAQGDVYWERGGKGFIEFASFSFGSYATYPNWQWHTYWKRKPNPGTHYCLRFDQLKEAIDAALIPRYHTDEHGKVVLNVWNEAGIQKYLESKRYLHEYHEPLIHDNMDTHGWAYDISIEELAQVLLTIDKYRVPPIQMSEWFSLWFKFNFADSEVRPEEIGGDSRQKLMILLTATYKFDHAEGFRQVTSRLRATGEYIPPLDLPLCERFPGLKSVLTPGHKLMECLNRRKYDPNSNDPHQNCEHPWYERHEPQGPTCTYDKDDINGLCLDCFNGSQYPFKIPRRRQPKGYTDAVVPPDLKMWGQRNFLKIEWKQNRFSRSHFDLGCRTGHGALVFYRSWVGESKEQRIYYKQHLQRAVWKEVKDTKTRN